MNIHDLTPQTTIHVLLVEDDEQDYWIIRDLFSDIEGITYTTDWVANYHDATQRLHSRRYDLFLFDYRLGCKTGLDLVTYARRIHSSTPSILLTGQEDRDVDVIAGKIGVVDYLIKGELTASTLERSIRYALERRKAEIERERLTEQLVKTSRQLGMAEVAINVLHNVGNVLNSLNVSTHQLTTLLGQSYANDIGQIAKMIEGHLHKWPGFLAQEPKGQHIPTYLIKLGEHVAAQHQAMLAEIQVFTSNLDHAKHIISAQQANLSSPQPSEALVLAQLMEQALDINLNAIAKYPITIVRDYSDIPPILSDKHQILQILVNLIRNAKHAMIDHPADSHCLNLTITKSEDDTRIQLSVQDTGIGIKPEHLTRIFSQGFTTKQKGHGLGLHGSALAAKVLKGSIDVFSAGEGQGARFTLDLPFTPVKEYAS